MNQKYEVPCHTFYPKNSPPSQRREQYLPRIQTRVPTVPFSSCSVDDWVVIRTTEHPKIMKPRHYGPITNLSQLFKNSFQESVVYDRYYEGHNRKVLEEIKIINFNGRNLELFRDFERGVLMKIINNKVLYWDAKFLFLMDNLSGCPLSTVQIYSDELTMQNFIQAIEDLWYTYGQPSKYRDALISELTHSEPVDLKRPETLKNTENLIVRIFRSFGMESSMDFTETFQMEFINDCIKMTKYITY